MSEQAVKAAVTHIGELINKAQTGGHMQALRDLTSEVIIWNGLAEMQGDIASIFKIEGALALGYMAGLEAVQAQHTAEVREIFERGVQGEGQ